MMLSIHGYVDPVPQPGQVDTGGQVIYVIEISKRLARMGVEVDIYTRWFEGRKRVEPVCPGVRIIRIPCGPPHFVRKEELYPYLDEFAENTLKYVRRERLEYDIIHSHYWDAGYVAVKLRESLRVPHVHTSHSLGAVKRARVRVKGAEELYRFDVRIRVERELLERADVIVSSSPLEPELIERYYGIRRDIVVVPPGVDVAFFSPSAASVSVGVPEPYAFTTGRIEYSKGFDLLIKAFRRVVSRVSHAHLVIGGGSLKPTELELRVRCELLELTERLGLLDRVHMVGRIPNEMLPAYYARSRVFVLPSRYDLFGMTAVEALACGTPVVVSKHAGVSRLMRREFSFVVDPEDEEELAEAVAYLLENEEVAKRMGARGREFVVRNLSWEKSAESLLTVYRKLAKG